MCVAQDCVPVRACIDGRAFLRRKGLENIGVRDLIKAGVHFGHRTSRWNPRMGPYIFKKRNLIHLINLKETVRGLVTGAKIARAVAQRGEYVLMAGTKRQAKATVRREACRCGMPFVSERWPGGLLTNYSTIRSRLERLLELERLEETGEIDLYSKKMVSSLRREKGKIEINLGGVRDMERLPGLVVIVDPIREHIAAAEARKLGILTVALTDTDGDPQGVDVVVPGNDDSIGSIDIFLRAMADAILEGRGISARPAAPTHGVAAPSRQAEEVPEQEEPQAGPAEATVQQGEAEESAQDAGS